MKIYLIIFIYHGELKSTIIIYLHYTSYFFEVPEPGLEQAMGQELNTKQILKKVKEFAYDITSPLLTIQYNT
jgi:hypothetical protein